MSNVFVFQPPRRLGLVFHLAAVLMLILIGAFGLWQAGRANIGPVFLIYLIPALLAIGLVPVLVYRAYALQRAFYLLERDGLRLHWGLRYEDIPMDSVLWVRPAIELEKALPLPWLRMPGSVLGLRHLSNLGEVEFMAASVDGLILIATPGRVFAISPDDPVNFLSTFRRFTELGSLTPLSPHSVYPTFLLARVWADKPARFLLVTGLILSLFLLVWVSLGIPSRIQVPLGFDASGAPRDFVPAVRLLLLPVLNTFLYLADLLLGLFFYRSEENKFLAYLLWGSGIMTELLFLAGVYFILQSG